MPRKKLILASICDWNLLIFRNAKYSRRLSKMSDVLSSLDPYFSWDRLCVDSNLNVIYTPLVTVHVLMFGKFYSYAASCEISLLCVTKILLEMIVIVVSLVVFIASKIRC